uniref:ENR1 protein n=1 Tax=Terrapene triunguis TaxID=2587831 RepID=A0A674J4V4_9SAUR
HWRLIILVSKGGYVGVWGVHNDNSFIQQQVWIAQTLNISNCWVCSHIPAHSQAGVPVLAIPLNSPELTGGPRPFNKTWNSNDTWEAVGINVSKWISVVEGKGHWCWVCNGTGLDLGKSRCLQHIVANGYYSCFVGTYVTNGCNRPFPALIGHHWVCGTKAYTVLPANWSGICYPARLFPQFRVLGSFPRERLRNFRRRRRDLSDGQWYVNNISPLTWEEAIGSSLIPLGGVIHHAKRLLRLQAVVEIMANETGESLKTLAKETGAIRQMALQNRQALDIVLAAKGGTYRASHLEQIASLPHEEPSSLWKWLSNLFNFSGIGNWLFQGALTILCGILMIFVCFQLISCCIQNCVRYATQVTTPKQSANMMMLNITERRDKELLICGTQ